MRRRSAGRADGRHGPAAVRSDDVILFAEDQRFTQVWLWVIVVTATAAAWFALVAAVVDSSLDRSTWVLAGVTGVVGIGLPVLFGLARLRVEVFADRVVIRFRPLTTRTIARSDITAVEALTYHPVRDYGGWGIKGWSRRKVAYNVRGDRGVLLTLADGRTVLIGSQHPDELAAAFSRGRTGDGSTR